jgi:plasmid stability protein
VSLETQYSDAQLRRINLQSILYLCSCPSQVGVQIDSLRRLYEYQDECSERIRTPLQEEVHARIAVASAAAHRIMEDCLKEILTLEGWDPETLEMPEGIRALLEKEIS